MLALRLRDVDLDSMPARLTFRAETTKTKERRISFITPEAVDAVKAWLTVRDEYIRTAAARVKGLNEAGYAGPKRLDDDRLFPFEDTSYRRGLQAALVRTGLADRCERTGRYVLHPMRPGGFSGLISGPEPASMRPRSCLAMRDTSLEPMSGFQRMISPKRTGSIAMCSA